LDRSPQTPWPLWPYQLRTSSSHEEGVQREWALFTQEFVGDGEGNLKGLIVCEMGWSDPEPGKKPKWEVIKGTEKEIPCELVLIAIGFLHPEHKGLLDEFGLDYDERGNIKDDGTYRTNKENVFAAGDARRGQSLVVWAISEGRECAYHIDEQLMGVSTLPRKDEGKMSIVD
jgi:glutamate synthase (NADPH/NADH) small chain